MGRLIFKDLSKERFKTNRNVVISEAYDTNNELFGYSIAEQLVTKEDDGKELKLFLKGGLGIVDRKGLAKLKLAVDEACEKAGITKEDLVDVVLSETEKF